MWLPSDDLHDVLVRELRAAVHARLAGGADPAEVLADLDRRLAALREMELAEARRAGPPTQGG
ncbi:hypothetical protein [Actinoplanes sp. ATCC 53533]|uniref:hypothetical protein n=1 Tax=Actinoplanes sp. ATCC 53533 TaxID=1288362 RepID=UPI000F7A7D17|nr:hypothetical protein [Actinoplanes sp. ATCC 53533]